VALPAPRSPDLGFQPGDHVHAFYNGGGNYLDDIVVYFSARAAAIPLSG
jgi:hypothetical protein